MLRQFYLLPLALLYVALVLWDRATPPRAR